MARLELRPRAPFEKGVNRAEKADVLEQNQENKPHDTPRHPGDDVIKHDRVRGNEADYQRSQRPILLQQAPCNMTPTRLSPNRDLWPARIANPGRLQGRSQSSQTQPP